jgi:hypothetical protein
VTAQQFGFWGAIAITTVVVVVAVVAMTGNPRPVYRKPARERITSEIFYPTAPPPAGNAAQ